MIKIKKMIKIISIFILVIIIYFLIYYLKLNNNTIASTKAIIVKVNEKSLEVMGIENMTEVFIAEFNSEGNIGFKQGQEIQIYYNGNIIETSPAKFEKVGKIKVVKEKSDISIPDYVLRRCYNSKDNINIAVTELTDTGVKLTITDTNKLPYKYSNQYTIYKKNYKESGDKWEEVKKVSNISKEDTLEMISYISQEKNNAITEVKIDWEQIYGKLYERRI